MNIDYKLNKISDKDISKIKERYGNGDGPLKISRDLNIKYGTVKYHLYKDRKKQDKTLKKKSDNHNKNSLKTYYRKKENDWFKWKADCLISGFQRRHKQSGIKYKYYSSRKEYAEILKVKLTTCEYCDVKLTKKNLSVDHKLPISRGGDTNDKNLAYCCNKCNMSKGSMTNIEYKELMSLVSTWNDNGKYILSRLRSSGYIFKKR